MWKDYCLQKQVKQTQKLYSVPNSNKWKPLQADKKIYINLKSYYTERKHFRILNYSLRIKNNISKTKSAPKTKYFDYRSNILSLQHVSQNIKDVHS